MRASPRTSCCRWTTLLFQRLPTNLTIVAGLVLLRPAGVPAQSETGPGEVRAALRQWREEFDSIRVEYRVACRQRLQDRFRDEEFADGFLKDWGRHGRLVWAGSDRFMLDVATLQQGEIVDVRRWGRDDGISWMAEGSRSRADRAARTHWWAVTLHLTGERDAATGVRIVPLTGLFDPERSVWIDGILSNSGAWSTGERVNIAGDECLELTRTFSEPDGRTPVVRRFALAPAQGYLPRLVRGTDRYSESVYEVAEFQKVQPGYWFPHRGTWLDSAAPEEVYQWEVTSVVVDPALPAGFFAPPDAEKIIFPEAEELARLSRNADPARVDAWMNWSFWIGLLLMAGSGVALAARWMRRDP
ncbi:MAG: hypothetical protein ACF8TS_05515 [Maioricimonas sp. JB049]